MGNAARKARKKTGVKFVKEPKTPTRRYLTREEYGTDVCPLTFQPDNAGNPQSVQLLGASRLNVNSNALNGCRGLNLTVARRN